MSQIRRQAKEFLDLVNKLKASGHKMHEISSILELHSPVLSSMCRTVLPAIIEPKDDWDSEETIIDNAFKRVNNLSKDKTLRNLQIYIEHLKSIPEERVIEQSKDVLEPYRNSIVASYDAMKTSFPGLYECYTHATNTKTIKKEPFLISDNYHKKCIEIRKGNQNTEHSFEGYSFLSGSHLISIFLIDSPKSIQETGLMQLIQPFTKSFAVLRGIYLNLSHSKTPIARRVVLKKISTECTIEEFNEIPNEHFGVGGDSDKIDAEIMEYLSEPEDIMECVQLPHPSFEVQDLPKEKQLIKNSRSDI